MLKCAIVRHHAQPSVLRRLALLQSARPAIPSVGGRTPLRARKPRPRSLQPNWPQAVPDLAAEPLLRCGGARDTTAAAPSSALAAGCEAWKDAGGYYMRNISRIQTLWEVTCALHDASDRPHCGSLILQLHGAVVQPGGAAASLVSGVSFGQEGDQDSSWNRRGFTSTRARFGQAAKRPSDDLSGAEVETAVRLGEHLLHLQRTQRRSLAATAAAHATLCRLASVTGSISASEPLPNQVRLPHTQTTHAQWLPKPTPLPALQSYLHA